MKFKCLVVDDEPLSRKLVASHVSKIEALDLVGECGSAVEANNLIRTKPVDLIFLDIQMPVLSGVDFIRSLKNPPSIILITAHRDFAIEAFDLDVVDYLLKPISFERFLKSVDKFFNRANGNDGKIAGNGSGQPDFIYMKSDRKAHKVLLDDILFIESLDDYVKVNLKSGTLITRENISTLEQKLPGDKFVRIHRSFLIAVKEVSAISAETIQMGKKEFPFGRAFKKSALAILNYTSRV